MRSSYYSPRCHKYRLLTCVVGFRELNLHTVVPTSGFANSDFANVSHMQFDVLYQISLVIWKGVTALALQKGSESDSASVPHSCHSRNIKSYIHR